MYPIYIKYLPKDRLLYELWLAARVSASFKFCKNLLPVLTLPVARDDINEMIREGRNLDLTTYYGRLLFIDISGDYLDSYNYDLYNGHETAENIVKKLKEEELFKALCAYYKFW